MRVTALDEQRAREIHAIIGEEIQAPYPESAFREVTESEWAKVRDVLDGIGVSLDRVSASNMRHVGKVIAEAPERSLSRILPPGASP